MDDAWKDKGIDKKVESYMDMDGWSDSRAEDGQIDTQKTKRNTKKKNTNRHRKKKKSEW